MREKFPEVDFVICDVRDRDAVMRLLRGNRYFEYVIHAAALKHIKTAEEQPEEAIKTNINGTRNIVDALGDGSYKMVLVSTDKAVKPANAYGWTKNVAEKIVLEAGGRVVRYGNVFGSRGSVLHKFKRAAAEGSTFTIHHKDMTRFVITFRQAILTILSALCSKWVSDEVGGYFGYDSESGALLMVPKLPAIRVTDLARAFDENAVFKVIGIQPGEKLAEELMLGFSSDKARMLSVDEIRTMIGRTDERI
jgi:UDP-N-acetylglucosamine 4,6-dehydratase